MPEIPMNQRRKPWEKRPSKGFKRDGSTFRPFAGARSSGDSRYGSKHWRSMRVRILEAYPVCPVCMDGGRMTASAEVDHIEPHIQHDFYDEDNLWALCKSCHAKKSAHESNGAEPDGSIDSRQWWIDRINKNNKN